jgi:hypothetical protein
MMKKRVVQTEVAPEVYEFVLRTAKAKGLTLKEAAREALREWAAREGDLSWDPLFDPDWGFKGGKKTDSSKVNEVLYARKKKK